MLNINCFFLNNVLGLKNTFNERLISDNILMHKNACSNVKHEVFYKHLLYYDMF